MLKNFGFPGFGVPCGLQIFRFLASDFRFSRKILTGFRIWCPIRFLVFLFDLFGFRFLFDLSGNSAPPIISNSSQTQTLSRRMRDRLIEISQGSLGRLRVAYPPPLRWGVRLSLGTLLGFLYQRHLEVGDQVTGLQISKRSGLSSQMETLD